MLTRRTALAGLSGAVVAPRFARAQAPVIKIGVLQDGSGPYSYLGGASAVVCARQAIEELKSQLGLEVELLPLWCRR